MTSNTVNRSLFPIPILLALTVVGGITPGAWAESNGNAVSRPFSSACSTRIEVLSPPNTFPLQLHIDSECKSAHLGLTVGSTSQTVVPASPPIGQTLPLLIWNSTTYRAANGDQLFVIFVGSATADLVTGIVNFRGTETFNGGTGRFAGASGTDSLEGSASNVTNTGEFTTRGTLIY